MPATTAGVVRTVDRGRRRPRTRADEARIAYKRGVESLNSAGLIVIDPWPVRVSGVTRRCDRRSVPLQSLVRTQRIVAPLAAALLVLAGLTSCSPVRKGITGLTVDVDGRPLAVLAWCAERPPDDVTIFPVPDSVLPAPSGVATPSSILPSSPPVKRNYAVPRKATSPTTVPLVDFPPKSATDPDTAFRMYGFAEDASFTSNSVDFRLSELAGLKPGSILITTLNNGDQVQQSVSLDEFTRRVHDLSEC